MTEEQPPLTIEDLLAGAPRNRDGSPPSLTVPRRPGRPPKDPDHRSPSKALKPPLAEHVVRVPAVSPTQEPPADWEDAFFSHYREWGSKARAAKLARVSDKVVKERERNSAEFRDRLEAEHVAFIDGLEADLVELARRNKNVVALIFRLKGELPHKYHDKLVVDGRLATLNMQIGLDAEQARVLLRTMLADSTDATHAALKAAPELVALPAAQEP